ncbi:MAG: hypothetical protein U0237_01240 [Thermoleophilia bacterium]
MSLDFPNLAGNFQLTSPVNRRYNCIAWAAGRTDRWWWPAFTAGGHLAPGYYWPPGAPTDDRLSSFEVAFETLGYRRCNDGTLEAELEKVALYATDGRVLHAARQLPDGAWTSKLGQNVDIAHTSPEAVEGPAYGQAVAFLSRRRTGI